MLSLSRYIINTYRRPAHLILNNGMEITSREGTTQGDNLAMAFYAVSIKPLIDRLKAHLCHQPWFADDAASIGKLQHVKSWWESLLSLGPIIIIIIIIMNKDLDIKPWG